MFMLKKINAKKVVKKQEARIYEIGSLMRRYENISKNSKPTEVLKNLVNLFDEVSSFQDAGCFDVGLEQNLGKYYPDFYEALNGLNKFIKNLGRCMYGMNRTNIGQHVYAKDVVLGDELEGLGNTVAYYLNLSDSDINVIYSVPTVQVAAKFAKAHIESNIKMGLNAIKVLEAA